MGQQFAQIELPESPVVPFTEYAILPGDDWIIISDAEIPDHDVELFELALLLGIAQNIKQAVFAGDYLATDQPSLSTWGKQWMFGGEVSYENTVGLGAKIIHEYLKWFEKFSFIQGNHDKRINKKTEGEVWLGMLLAHTKASISRYEYLYLDTCRGMVKVSHPQNFSSNPVALGQQLYDKERGPYFDKPQKCHYVIGHTHLQQSGWSKDGLFEIHALGCMRDPLRTQYKQMGDNKHHQWVQGFLMIKDGHFYPMTKYGTNWDLWLGEGCACCSVWDGLNPLVSFSLSWGKLQCAYSPK